MGWDHFGAVTLYNALVHRTIGLTVIPTFTLTIVR